MPFLSTFRQLPGTWSNLLLVIVSGSIESFGLSLFIPLLHVISGNEIGNLPRPFSDVVGMFDRVGIKMEPVSLLLMIVGFSLIALAVSYLQRKNLSKSKERYAQDLRNKLFGTLFNSNWSHSSKSSHGDIVNQLIQECSRSATALTVEVMAVGTAVLIAIYLVFSVIISWQLMVIAVAFGALIYVIVIPFTNRAKILGEHTVEANRDVSFVSLEFLRSMKLLKATANEDQAIENFTEKNSKLFTAIYHGELNATRVNIIVQALPVLLMATIIGFSLGVMDLPTSLLLVFLLFMARTAPRIAQFQQQLQTYLRLSPALRVIRQTIDKSIISSEDCNPDGKIFEHLKDKIVLNNVSFKYPDGDAAAIESVSIAIERHQTVAIVGSSGAGKSTLMDLLTGLQKPDEGSITIDGVDLGEFNLKSWRKRLGIVTQDTVTFNESLRKNLRFFHKTATDADLARALTVSKLDEVVAELPDGMDTTLGESGVRFSGGQKQRVAIARALVGKPDFLLLDEATSALDNESEYYFQEALTIASKSMTILVIAHRLSTVRRADLIYVMEKGQVVESGTDDQLVSRGGRFAELQSLELSR